MPIYLINSLTSEQLELAYGDKPPIPPVPAPVVATIPQNQNTGFLVNSDLTYNFEFNSNLGELSLGFFEPTTITKFFEPTTNEVMSKKY